MNPFDSLIAEIGQAVRDVTYAAGVASGTLTFDLDGMTKIIGDLRQQQASVKTAAQVAGHQLVGVVPKYDVCDVSGVNVAWGWLAGTAVDAGSQVSFEENLRELDQLVVYLTNQLSNVKAAYIEADSAGREDLNSAAATVFNGNREQPGSVDGTLIGLDGVY